MAADKDKTRGRKGAAGSLSGSGHPGGADGATEKPKSVGQTARRLLTYLKSLRIPLAIVLIAAICATGSVIVTPMVIGQVTTELYDGFRAIQDGSGGVDIDAVQQLLLIAATLYVSQALFTYVQQFLMARVTQTVVYNLRRSVKEKLDRLPLKYYDGRTKGEILSRVINDVDLISTTLQDSLVQSISAAVTLVGVLFMMLYISPIMTLIAILSLPLSVFITVGVARRSQKYFAAQQKSLGDLNGHIEEMYGGHTVVKAFSREETAVARFEELNARYFGNAWKAQFISGVIRPAMMFVGNLGYVAVCVVGGVLVTQGTILFGEIQAFIQYMRSFSQPITQLASISNTIQATLAAAERTFEVLDESEQTADPENPVVLATVQGSVEFQHVTFGYDPDTVIIEDLSVMAKPGQMIAIVGPTGAGKSTLVNLLMRFYEIDGGWILLDGVDTRCMTRHELRSHFGMVLQDTWLFSGTIRDNIAYGREGATDEEVVKAAVLAHADHFIRTLPEGYDTRINEEANNVSVGQKQLITIARALLANPAVLILDEATSSIDTRTEQLVQKAMRELMEDRTSFVIAHRLSTIREADAILVMRDGTIVEQGTHEELLALDGFYADLYNSQFVDCIDEIEAA